MPTPISTLYSAIDSMKRILADRLSNPVADVEKTLGRAKEDAAAFRETQKAGGPAATEAMLNTVLNNMPGAAAGKILFHGGPSAVTKINPALATNNIEGPGFYLSNILNTPLTFATRGQRSGVISAFDVPDELYAKMLRLSDKPTTAYPELDQQITKLLKDTPELQSKLDIRTAAYGDSRPTGNWINQQLAALFGFDRTAEKLAVAGIPGKTWQYSRERPAELATVLLPNHYNMLSPIAQLDVMPGISGARTANVEMKKLLGIK